MHWRFFQFGLATVVTVSVLTLTLGNEITSNHHNDLETPFPLKADGKIIDSGEQWGHSSPCVVDLDGDGRKDLIVGDFSGYFKIYKNVGTEKTPEFQADGNVQAGGQDAKVRIYCCIGSQARFCDLNADGIPDMISNSYDPGNCYLFRGVESTDGKLAFAASQEVVDRSGTPVRTYPVQQQTYQSFGSFYETVDWDNDGDLDILIGTFEGPLKLRINEGTATVADFATANTDVQADGEPLRVKAHCCPRVVDWNGDGLWDIIAGSDDGSVSFFRNIGKTGVPQFAKGELLVNAHSGNGYDVLQWSDKDMTPGIRSQVEVADFNGDGKLDLIVGDFYTAYDVRSDLTDAQKEKFKEMIEESRVKSQAAADQMSELRADFAKRFPGEKIFSDEADKAWTVEYKAMRENSVSKDFEKWEKEFVKGVRPFLATTRGGGDESFDLAKSHGHVWVYLRK